MTTWQVQRLGMQRLTSRTIESIARPTRPCPSTGNYQGLALPSQLQGLTID